MLRYFSFLLVPLLALTVVAQTPPTPGTPGSGNYLSTKPNFSGRWRMVKDKSSFSGFTVPDVLVQVVDDHIPAMNVHTVETLGGKTSTADVTYFTDGRQSSNVVNGREATSKTFWDGQVLVVRTDMKDSKGDDIEMEDRWILSPDKQTLTRSSHVVTSNGGEVNLTLVCQKESTH
jgi:hypothetical protein